MNQVNDSNNGDVQAPDSSTANLSRGGFRAHLQGVGLHDLVMLQNLVRTSGVFVVLSGDRTGTLCFARGQLVHAEVLDLTGDAAALEILSWRDGEFINADRTSPDKHTVSSSLDALLLRLAKEADETRASEPPITTATGVRLRVEAPVSFRTTHLGLGAPPSPRGLAAAATPGIAAPVPKAALRTPEPRSGVTNVVIGPLGTVVDGNGSDPEGLGSKVAYMMRLTELVAQSMGGGDARAIRVRHPNADLVVRRHADGHISASQGPADAIGEATPPSSAPPPARHL